MRSLWILTVLGWAIAQSVPKLPFPDNPDPTLCGIPTAWNSQEPGWLDGHYGGKLIEPTVYLYDSHYRNRITGKAPSGSKVKILLFQANPKLNYYLIRTLTKPEQEGWVPEPFLRLKQ